MSAELELLFSYTASISLPPEVIGELADGLRVHFYFDGGSISGSRLSGQVLPVGGDWLVVRRDGVGVVDVRSTIQTHDGALIFMSHGGVLDFGPEGYENVLRGNLPDHIPIRSAPRFQTAHPDYLWLNRVQGYAIGNVEPSLVRCDVFAAPAEVEQSEWARFDEGPVTLADRLLRKAS